MTRQRCAVAGCPNWARRGETHCVSHRDERSPRYAERVAVEQGERDRAAVAEFRGRIVEGEYERLYDSRIAAIIEEAASRGGVREELGALRYVLARLLAEEDDPMKLAAVVPKVATVSIQAARAQRAMTGDLAASLTDAITQILHELDGGP